MRSSAFAVLALATVSVASFPSLGGARTLPPTILRAAVLTTDGTDGYVYDAIGATIKVFMSRRTAGGGNLRTVFWPADAVSRSDVTSCATWSRESSDRLQQGLAVRISERRGGAIEAITVTKNVFPFGSWVFNVHVWDSATARFRLIASVNLAGALSRPGDPPTPQPLPWRVCARVVGRTFTFKAWRTAIGEPAWGDPQFGGSVRLPADAPSSGYPGGYIGHLQPGMSATFVDLTAVPVVSPPPPTDAVQALAR